MRSAKGRKKGGGEDEKVKPRWRITHFRLKNKGYKGEV